MNDVEMDTTTQAEPQHEEEERVPMNLSGDTTQSRILTSASLKQQQGEEEEQQQPHFPKLNAVQASGNRVEYRRVRCPPHRYTPLREHWEQILTPLVEYLQLQVRTTRNRRN